MLRMINLVLIYACGLFAFLIRQFTIRPKFVNTMISYKGLHHLLCTGIQPEQSLTLGDSLANQLRIDAFEISKNDQLLETCFISNKSAYSLRSHLKFSTCFPHENFSAAGKLTPFVRLL